MDFRQPEYAIEEASAPLWVGRIDQPPIIQTNDPLAPRNCRPRFAAGVGVTWSLSSCAIPAGFAR
jgi:hypothetical protein